jgi:hypothetical protein
MLAGASSTVAVFHAEREGGRLGSIGGDGGRPVERRSVREKRRRADPPRGARAPRRARQAALARRRAALRLGEEAEALGHADEHAGPVRAREAEARRASLSRTKLASTRSVVTSRQISTSLAPIVNLRSLGILATRSMTQIVSSSVRRAMGEGSVRSYPGDRGDDLASPGAPPPGSRFLVSSSPLMRWDDQGFEDQGSRKRHDMS